MNRQRVLSLGRPLLAAAREHRLTTHATAIAFRLLVALVPIVILAAAILSMLGLEDVWRESITPPVKERVTSPTYSAIDAAIHQIFGASKPPLLAAALALLLWEASRAVRAVSNALNEIHDAREQRPWWRVTLVTLGLAVAVSGLVIGAFLVTIVGGRTGTWISTVLRWPLAILLLGVAVALLLRYAPSEQPNARWVSAGSAAIVGGWLILSLAFGFWVAEVANYKSPIGTLLAVLVVTAYALGTAAVFIVGAELDELLRTRHRKGR